MATKSKITIANETPEKYLTEGADILLKEFGSPANLLDFFTRSLNWLEDYIDDKEKDGHVVKQNTFFIRILTDQLLQPWVEGGKDINASIKNGLEEVYDTFGYEDYIEYLSRLLKGFAVNMIEGPYQNGITKKYMVQFSAMIEIGSRLNDYNIYRKAPKQEDVSSGMDAIC